MGFPYEPSSWDGVSGAIFMGFGGAAPGFFSLIAIIACIAALAIGQKMESGKYKDHE